MSRSFSTPSVLLALLFALFGSSSFAAPPPPPPPSPGETGTTSEGWQPTANVEANSFLLAAGRGVIWAGSSVSTNNAASWVATETHGIDRLSLDDVAIDPRDSTHVWVVSDIGSIFETRDGGASYNTIIDPSRSGFRYSSVYAIAPAASDPNVLFTAKNGFGIFRSGDGGRTWKFLKNSGVDYSYSIAVDPTSADIVFAGSTRKPFQNSAVIRQSTDRGENWRTALEIKDGVSVTSIAIDAKTPGNVYAASTGNEGALWVSHDRGSSWQRLANGFDFTSVHRLATSPSEPAVAYAGILGGGIWRTADRGRSWSRLPAPTDSVSGILIDPRNPQVMYIADRNTPTIWRSNDSGTTWTKYFDAGRDFYRVQSVALSQSDPDVMYTSVFARTNVPTAGTLFRIEHGVAAPTVTQVLRPCTDLAVDPHDDRIVYTAEHGWGASKSTDGGATWQNMVRLGSGLPFAPAFGFNGISIDAASPGSVELFGGCDVGFDFFHTGASPADMHAIYRSTNGGTSWAQIGAGSFGSITGPVKGLTRVAGRPGMLLAETAAGLRVSTDNGATWSAPPGDVTVVQPSSVATSSDGLTIYVPTLGGGVRTGTIANSGSITWEGVSTLHAAISHIQVLVDPANSMTLYATAYPGGIYKSVDGGASWTEQNFGMASHTTDDGARQGRYVLAVAPSNPKRLYVGVYGVGIYTSVDAGGVWRPANGALAEMRGNPITSIIIDPANDKKLWVSGDDGIQVTANAGTRWTQVNTGLASTEVAVLVRGSDGRFFAGSKGYEAWALDRDASSWQQLPALANFGTTWPIWDDRPLYQFTTALFHPTDPRIVYLGTFPAGIFRSDDGGTTWRERNIGWTSDGLFSLAVRPDDPKVLYAGTGNGINRSTDSGEHWNVSNQGWPPEQWVYSIDFDPRDSRVIYACSKNGENAGRGRADFKGTVMKSRDGGATWSAITNGLDLRQSFYKIIVDRKQPDTVYLASEHNGVLISRDGGVSWSAFNDGLTSLDLMTNGNHVSSPMLLSPEGFELFVATTHGVFRRTVATGVLRHRAVRP